MAKIKSIGAMSTDKLKTHKIEVIVEFDEPVTFSEAQNKVLEAVSEIMYGMKESKQYNAEKVIEILEKEELLECLFNSNAEHWYRIYKEKIHAIIRKGGVEWK